MNMENKLWSKLYPIDVPRTMAFPSVPLHDILRKAAREYPKKVAVAYFAREITYGELDALSDRFASTLANLGVKRGDKVAVFLPNIPQFVVAYFGILKAGAILTTISPLHREREVVHQLSDSEAGLIITLDSLYPIVEKVWSNSKLRHVITTSIDDYASNVPVLPGTEPKRKPHVFPFVELLRASLQQPPDLRINSQEDVALLQYTGGTTGVAKGAMLTHANLVSNAAAFATWIKGDVAKDTFLSVLPLFHIYGMTTSLNVPVSLAAKIVLLPKFDPVAVLETIEKHRVTVFCGVPTMYSVLVANPTLANYDLTSIRVCISGASSLPPQVQSKFMEVTGGFLAEGYGLTEASPVTHCNPVDETMKTVKVGSIGLPLPGTDAQIRDVETGEKTLKPREIGELVIRGPQVMRGYWKDPEQTSRVLREGWLYTGDIGWMDEDGYFYITDRKKDLIKYKDYSVYPREIEDILYEHPAVKLCTVIGKPDSTVGETPKAFIVLKQGTKATEEEIIQFVREKVAPYKTIREVEFREELPISPAGKVLKRVLQEEERQKNKLNHF